MKRKRRNLTVQEFVPNDFDITSKYEKEKFSQPGVAQYSKVAKFIKNKRIHSIVNNKKRVANIKQQQWEDSIRYNLRPKTTSYIQKMLNKEVQSQKVERNVFVAHNGFNFNQPKKKKDSIILDLTGNKGHKTNSKGLKIDSEINISVNEDLSEVN